MVKMYDYSDDYSFKNYFSGREIQKKNFSYWYEYPLNEMFSKLPKGLTLFLFVIYIILTLGLQMFLVSKAIASLFPSIYGWSEAIGVISGLIMIFFYSRSKEKLDKQSKELFLLIETKFQEELKVYFFIMTDLNSEYETNSKREKKISNLDLYFERIFKETNVKINRNLLVGLLKIHFNTDYDKKHNYSTERIHPFFLEIQRRYGKELDYYM